MAREPEPARPEAEVEVEAAARRILAERLAGARWSASKGRTTMAVELADVGWLGHHGAGRHALAIVRVTFADGGPGESYLLPLVVDDGAPREACPTDGTWGAVADAVRVGLVVRGTRGLFTFEAEPGADDAGGPPGPRARAADPGAPSAAPRERPVGDQTHSSAVVDGDRVVKLLRRLGPGGAREVRVGWLLGGASPFRGSPALLGHAAHVGAGGMTTVLGLVHAFVPDARDGYEATNSAIRAWLGVPDEAGLRVSTDAAADLGRLTARLHRRLGGDDGGEGPAAGRPDVSPSARRALRRAGEVAFADAVDAARGSGRAGGDRLAGYLVAISPRVLARLAALEDADLPLAASLGHGDLHLGQTLATSDGRWLAIDFEGEPAGSEAVGDEPEPPAVRDVAGMLRSFDHVARSACRRVAVERSADPALDPGADPVRLLAAVPPDLRASADRWIAVARRRYLAAYRAEAGSPMRPSASAHTIHALEVQKECYELAYAARFLPSWSWAPVGGLGWLLAHPPRHVASASAAPRRGSDGRGKVD